MVRTLGGAAFLLAFSSALVTAQTTCGAGSKCPEDSPCCSQYGQCGTGAFCLGGCDTLNSFSLASCAPAPVCQNRDIKFPNMNRLASNDKYLGDPSKVDFVYSGEPLIFNDSVLLTMTQNSSGTLLASSEYVWYGKVSANMTTSGGQGVVTAFILLSDVKDEIDFEFVGYNLTQAQTNYYFQGIEDYTHGGNSSVPGGNSMTDWHIYTLDWQPDSITWSIDNNEVRKLDKSSTWNSTANRYDYPQTPSRVELSIWPAGSSKNAPGTVAWSGGPINRNDPRYVTNDYYFAAFSEINVECYDPPQGANSSGKTSYIYTGDSGLNNTVAITDDKTVLGSFEATGTNMTAGADKSGGASSPTSVPDQGSSGTGANGNRGGNGNNGGNGGGSSGTGTSSSSASASSGFVQGGGNSNSATAAVNERGIFHGSIFAMLVAIVGMVVL